MEIEKPIGERIKEVEAEFRLVLALENTRQAAEVAYVAAKLYQEIGELEQSEYYAQQSVRLFERSGVTTIEDAYSRYNILAGVSIPGLIHEDVVRAQFPQFHL
jgi:hypothetical protein